MHRPIFGEMTQVRFVVITPDAPGHQPPEIYCSLSIDGWPAKGRALKRIAPNTYTAAGPMRAGAWIEYKFLRGAIQNGLPDRADAVKPLIKTLDRGTQ